MDSIRRRWIIVLLFLALGGIGAIAGLLIRGPAYVSTEILQLPVANAGSTDISSDDIEYTDRLINTYKQIADSEDFERVAAKRVGTTQDIQFSFEPRPNTELIDFSATADSSSVARDAVRVGTTLLLRRVSQLSTKAAPPERLNRQLKDLNDSIAGLQQASASSSGQEKARLEEQIQSLELIRQALTDRQAAIAVAADRRSALTVVAPAGRATKESITSSWRLILLILVLSGLAGVGVAILLERRYPQLRTPEDVESLLAVPVVASIGWLNASEADLINGDQAASPGAVQELLATVTRLPVSSRAVAFTSLNKGAGRTRLTLETAVALARLGYRTLLIDADPEEPRASSLLIGGDPARSWEGVAVPRGERPAPTRVPNLDTLEASTPDALAPLRDALKTGRRDDPVYHLYEFILIDSPTLNKPDPLGVPAHATSFLVIPILPLPAKDIARAITRSGRDVTGVILNRRAA